MEFYLIVLLSASLALLGSLLIVYFNTTSNYTFPSAMTNCPDNWAINTKTGNCIIPSREISGANLGNFAHNTQASLIYEYVIVDDSGKSKTVYSLSPSFKGKKGAPYISPVTKQTVYHYSSRNNANSARSAFPSGYPIDFDPENPEASNEVDFSQWAFGSYQDYIYQNDNRVMVDVCSVKSWANSNNIAWDGVNNHKGKCVY